MNKRVNDILQTLETKIGNYVPHMVLVLCLLTMIVFIFNVNGQGFVPFDDCLRHCAKAVSGKPWNEILIIRPEYHDHNIGWHRILEWAHNTFHAEVAGLIGFSVIVLFLCATVPLFFLFRRPEAWLGGVLLLGLLYFGDFYRLFYGRPYLVATGGTLLLLTLWSKQTKRRPIALMVFTTLLFALMTCIHGSFYLYIIPIGAFLLAGQWKNFLWLLPCYGLGVLFGMLASGDPAGLWSSQILHLEMITRYKIEKRFLVSEFWPSPAFAGCILTITLFLVLRYLREKTVARLWSDPVFVLLIGMGILGFRNVRFWLDFGMPAMLLWVAREIEALLEVYSAEKTFHRLILSGGLCAAFFLMLSANIGDRWDNNHPGLHRWFPSADDKDLAGWFPEDGGIFYNRDMGFFYNTFAANPHANWRYTLGFEPNIMTDENLEIYRNMQKNDKWTDMLPWVKKMTKSDRMVLYGGKPEVEELEWKEVFPGLWFGRLPSTEILKEGTPEAGS
jgi:hypothetical protein